MFPKKAAALLETGFIFKQCGFVEDRLYDVTVYGLLYP